MKNSQIKNFLSALGLHRKELLAWSLYDWGNSAYVTIVMATILPIYYSEVATQGLEPYTKTALWGYTSGISLLISAIFAISALIATAC